uniref:Uncharacterized protein n=1 Tax=Musa acuminata subsp. malaccensis TaxID=214687 RepID=A0A804HNJ9_MUSAM
MSLSIRTLLAKVLTFLHEWGGGGGGGDELML